VVNPSPLVAPPSKKKPNFNPEDGDGEDDYYAVEQPLRGMYGAGAGGSSLPRAQPHPSHGASQKRSSGDAAPAAAEGVGSQSLNVAAAAFRPAGGFGDDAAAGRFGNPFGGPRSWEGYPYDSYASGGLAGGGGGDGGGGVFEARGVGAYSAVGGAAEPAAPTGHYGGAFDAWIPAAGVGAASTMQIPPPFSALSAEHDALGSSAAFDALFSQGGLGGSGGGSGSGNARAGGNPVGSAALGDDGWGPVQRHW
jgi:hypothetical protein